jgi:CRP/FNR family cyclic AMP-dependent transcriptional regulator
MKLLTFLQDLPAFERFSEDELEAFISCSSMYEFPEGHIFSSEEDAGDSTYLLISGRVRVFQHDTVLNKTLAANEICAGEMFNILALVENLTVPTTAVALESSIALKFPRESLSKLKATSPRVAHQFQYMVAIQLANALFSRNAELRARL